MFGENKYHVNDVGSPSAENPVETTTESSSAPVPAAPSTSPTVQNKLEPIENLDDDKEEQKTSTVAVEPVKQEAVVVQQTVAPTPQTNVSAVQPAAPVAQPSANTQTVVQPGALAPQGTIPAQSTVVTNTTTQASNKFII